MPSEPPSPETLRRADACELLAQDGSKTTFGALVNGRRTVVILIRHFWCLVCKTYVQQLGECIPVQNLPEGTQVIIIGCGYSGPIAQYAAETASPYAIYANPDLSLYKLFEFSTNLKPNAKGSEKEYESELGSSMNRVWEGLKQGPLRNIGMANSVGPKSQNGGEMVLEQDGSCSFFHRMMTTADHTDLSVLAKAIGADYNPRASSRRPSAVTCDGEPKAA